MKIDKLLLESMINDKLVSVQKHPDANLFIYNYTPKVQYEKLWNEITLITRGLILDENMNLVARPFSKFFNIEEHQPNDIPNLPFEVFDKLDGSLGIMYWLENKPYIASRGSFNSEQALHATKILYDKYQHVFDKLDKESTYIFEIIYPENRIVVDYGATDDIYLLTIIDNKTGEERIEDIGFNIVKKYDGINDLSKLKTLEENNREGFVVRFSNNFRIKVKFSEYVRLHRIVTGVSNLTIWEYLSENKNIEEILDRVPDEFYDWVKTIEKDLYEKYNNILKQCESDYMVLPTRKETALYFSEKKYPSVLFLMLDNRNVDKNIWKLIKPTYKKPFAL